MDKPVTDAELDQFYGTEVSPAEVKAAIERHAKAFDAEDLMCAIGMCTEDLLIAIRHSSGVSIQYILIGLMRQLIADRVSIELFGRHGCVKANEVTL